MVGIVRNFLILLFSFAFVGFVEGAVLTVCSSGCDHTTISAAITAAGSGDEIQIKTGSYDEGMDLDGKDNLTVTNYQSDSVTLTGYGGTSALGRFQTFIQSDNLTISNLTFAPNQAANVYAIVEIYGASNGVTIDNCTFTGIANDTQSWLILREGADLINITITSNSFEGYANGSTWSALNFQGPNLKSIVFRDNDCDFSQIGSHTSPTYINYMNEEAGTNYCYFERNYFHGIGSEAQSAFWMFRETDGTYVRNNVFLLDSDYSAVCLFQVRGQTDGGDSCDSFWFTNNTVDVSTSNPDIFYIADTPVDVEITNNLVIGNFGIFADDLSPFNTGSGNSVQNNHATDATVTWNGGLGGGWTFSNNTANQSVVWNNSGDKPNPFYDLTESLDGGDFAWDPANDYNQDSRLNTPDVGGFEYESANGGPSVIQGVTIQGCEFK